MTINDDTKTATYSIGALSRLSGVKVESIRYCERVGLLPAADRESNGFRQYDSAFVERLAFIQHAREFGFTIDEIRELLALAVHCPELRSTDADRITRDRVDALRGEIQVLQRKWRALRQ
jgi:MerR family mercuric resistance operon transcriptional regulator